MSYGVIYRHQAPISHGIDDKGVYLQHERLQHTGQQRFGAWLHGYMVATNNARLYGCLHATVRAINHVTVQSFKGVTTRTCNRPVMHATVHAAGKPYKQTVLQTTSNNLKQ